MGTHGGLVSRLTGALYAGGGAEVMFQADDVCLNSAQAVPQGSSSTSR